eukprot:9501489-Pyramimonas_sp.AAC.1
MPERSRLDASIRTAIGVVLLVLAAFTCVAVARPFWWIIADSLQADDGSLNLPDDFAEPEVNTYSATNAVADSVDDIDRVVLEFYNQTLSSDLSSGTVIGPLPPSLPTALSSEEKLLPDDAPTDAEEATYSGVDEHKETQGDIHQVEVALDQPQSPLTATEDATHPEADTPDGTSSTFAEDSASTTLPTTQVVAETLTPPTPSKAWPPSDDFLWSLPADSPRGPDPVLRKHLQVFYKIVLCYITLNSLNPSEPLNNPHSLLFGARYFLGKAKQGVQTNFQYPHIMFEMSVEYNPRGVSSAAVFGRVPPRLQEPMLEDRDWSPALLAVLLHPGGYMCRSFPTGIPLLFSHRDFANCICIHTTRYEPSTPLPSEHEIIWRAQTLNPKTRSSVSRHGASSSNRAA